MIYYDLINEKYTYKNNFFINKKYLIKNGYSLIDKKKLTEKSLILCYKNKDKYICIYNEEKIDDIVVFINNSDKILFKEEKIRYLINYDIYKKNKNINYQNILNNILDYFNINF